MLFRKKKIEYPDYEKITDSLKRSNGTYYYKNGIYRYCWEKLSDFLVIGEELNKKKLSIKLAHLLALEKLSGVIVDGISKQVFKEIDEMIEERKLYNLRVKKNLKRIKENVRL